MQKYCCFFIFWLFCTNTFSEDAITHLYVWTKDHNKVAYALSDNPKVTFSESCLEIESKGVVVNFPLENLDQITYVPEITGLKELSSEKEVMKIDEESLIFPDLHANSVFSLYKCDGSLIFNKVIPNEGKYIYHLSNLTHGVYIVKVNGTTYKFLKR